MQQLYLIIRLVPYWNVNWSDMTTSEKKYLIRLVPYWNVNEFEGKTKEDKVELEQYHIEI